MKIRCKYDELIEVSKLKLIVNPNNRNKHTDESVKRMALVMRENYVRRPIVISNQTQTITKGHKKLLAAELNNWQSFPVEYQDYESPAQQFADEVADNATAQDSELDFAGIHLDLPDHGPDLNVEALGLPNFEVEPLDKLLPEVKRKCPTCGKAVKG